MKAANNIQLLKSGVLASGLLRHVKVVTLLACLILASSCSRQLIKEKTTTTTETNTEVKADTTVTVEVRDEDSTLVFPAENATDEVQLDEFTTIVENDKGVITSKVDVPERTVTDGRVTIKTKVLDNLLTVEATCDSLEAVVAWQDSVINTQINTIEAITTTTTTETIREVPVKYIPKWIRWLAGIGAFSIFGWLVFVYLKFKP